MTKLFNKKTVIICTSVLLFLWACKRFISEQNTLADHLAANMLYPVLVAQRAIIQPLKHFFDRKKKYQELESQLYKIQTEYDALLAAHIQLQSTQLFFDEIQELVDFKKRYDTSQACIAQVLLKSISSQEHFWLVDAGSAHGIENDMVAVWKNCIVGRVTQVYRWYSKIMLITDQNCKIATHTAPQGTVGIYRGCNTTDKACLDHVSHLATLECGELLLSSGEGLIFPRGFAVGCINTYTQGSLFYDVEVKPLIDVEALEYCYLIKKGN